MIGALTAFVMFSAVAPAIGGVVLEYLNPSAVSGVGSWGPMAAVSVSTGSGACISTETTTLPFGSGSNRATVALLEPHGCPVGTRLTFVASDRFSDGLSTPASHTLAVRLDVTAMNGSTAMLRNVQGYVQRIGGANPIVTPTHFLLRGGVVRTASTSVAVLAPGVTYGLGLRTTLTHVGPLPAHATVRLVLELMMDDGGVLRGVQTESISVLLVY